jgi:hypothetical protein
MTSKDYIPDAVPEAAALWIVNDFQKNNIKMW